MDLECKLFFMNRNVMYTDFSTIASQLYKYLSNAIYIVPGWLMKQKYIAAASQYINKQVRVCWMTFTIFTLPS